MLSVRKIWPSGERVKRNKPLSSRPMVILPLGSKAMLTQEFSSLPAERNNSTSYPGKVKKVEGSVPASAFEARFHWV